jgi:predicted Fe-S protein YdhL (DUF1289 family)
MSSVLSPCVRNCCLNEDEICLGCFRSLSEITGWHQADDQQRLVILKTVETRHKEYQQKLSPRPYSD